MFAMEGADVAIVYLPEEQVDADKVKAMIETAGRQCLLFPQDIRDEAGCKRVIESVVQQWGRIDVLVNNASVMVCPGLEQADQQYSVPDILDLQTEQFDRTMKTNM
jgi:NAD(P)-dependent dehydrogenase (short-subunit alcohol dehydrogenase family)